MPGMQATRTHAVATMTLTSVQARCAAAVEVELLVEVQNHLSLPPRDVLMLTLA